MSDSVESAKGSQQEDPLYGGVCPVCGDEYTDDFSGLEERESIDGVRICMLSAEMGDCLMHLPGDIDE